MLASLTSTKVYEWVPASNGPVPPGAIVGGTNPGVDLYVCRAAYQGGVHPGKLIGGNCNIGWGGQEIEIPDYEVLVSQSPSSLKWVPASNGQVPPGAIVGGTNPGVDLYVCRAAYQSEVHSGKLIGGNCNIGWGGQEIRIPNYEVLVCEPSSEGELSVQISRIGLRENKELGDPVDEPRGEYVCRTVRRQVTETFTENLLLDPITDVIYPGGIIDGASIPTGGYRPITAPRAPLTFTISTQYLPKGMKSVTVNDPKLSTVSEAADQLVQGAVEGGTPAQVVYNEEAVYSENQLKVAVGGHYTKGSFDISGKFDFSRSSTTNKFVVKFLQVYYTTDVDAPAQPEDFFTNPRSISPDEVYVATITYGRKLLFTFESNEDFKKLEAAVKCATGSGGGEASAEYQRILRNTICRVLILGGSGEQGLKTITETSRIEAIKNHIQAGAGFSKESPAYPLSYKLRFVNDNSIANVILSTTFEERQCSKATGTFKVIATKLKCTSKGEPSANQEFFGAIWVQAFDTQGKAHSDKVCIWNKDKKHALRVWGTGTGDIQTSQQFFFKEFYKVKDTAYIEVSGKLKEADVFSDDDLGSCSKTVYLKNAAIDPSHEFGTDPGFDRKLLFQAGATKAEIWFEIEPAV